MTLTFGAVSVLGFRIHLLEMTWSEIHLSCEIRLKQIFCYPPSLTLGGMQYLRDNRIDVSNAEQLDRYEQLFELPLTHTIFGLGVSQSIGFVAFLTIRDVYIFRSCCFAIAVEIHDVIDDMTPTGVVMQQPPIGGQFQTDADGVEHP